MHILSREDLNSADLETVRVFKSPTTVVAANGEVHTKEVATVYVKELDLFVTVKLLEDTPAVLSLGKLCQEHGYSYEWTSGQRPQLIKGGAARRTANQSLSLVYRQALQAQLHLNLQRLYCRKQHSTGKPVA